MKALRRLKKASYRIMGVENTDLLVDCIRTLSSVPVEIPRNLKNDESHKVMKDFRWPHLSDENSNRALTNFMYSFRNPYNPLYNQKNLMMVMLPEGSGKTTFIRENVDKFLKSTSKFATFVVRLDLADKSKLNFDAMLNYIQQTICESMVSYIINNPASLSLMNTESIMSHLIFHHEPLYLEILMNRGLQRFSRQAGHLDIRDSSFFGVVEDLLEKSRTKRYRETPLLDNLDQFRKILGDSYLIHGPQGQRLLQKSDRLSETDREKILDLMATIEIINMIGREMDIDKAVRYRGDFNALNGVKSCNLLLDIMNLMTGYGYRQETMDPETQDFIHSVLVVNDLDTILNIKDGLNDRARKWVEMLFARLVSEEYFREHFPVIFETTQSMYVTKNLHDDLQIIPGAVPAIEHIVWDRPALCRAFSGIYNSGQMDGMFRYTGNNLRLIKLFTAALLQNKNASFNETLSLDTIEFEPDYRKFVNKVDSVYCRPEVAELVDNNQIDFALLALLQEFSTYLVHGEIFVSEEIKVEMMENRLMQALCNAGVLYISLVRSYIRFSEKTYFTFVERYLNERFSEMTTGERMRYIFTRKTYTWPLREFGTNRVDMMYHQRYDSAKLKAWDVERYNSYGKEEREGTPPKSWT
mmetsp:Transcript_17043/g.19127  ORF Transcript_17043/g.19127 Transcript_17043/m.19127 type:complete len:640 (-) Transcript_17043:149-2068(-)